MTIRWRRLAGPILAVTIAGTSIGFALSAAAATDLPATTALPAECSGSSPVVCHYDVAPGHYTVAVTFGGTTAGDTTMSVEARRRIIPAVSTAAGASTTQTVTVNVRQPEGQPTGQGGTGTAGLDITFAGTAPLVSDVRVSVASPPVIYLAGDSTTCDQPTAPYTGWGQLLPTHVPGTTSVANYSDSGESSGSFLANSALFPTMSPLINSGDVVMIQFGHNDKTVTPAAYQANLTSMVTQVKARGGVPVLVTPPVRRLFSGTTLTPTALHINELGADLPAAMKAVGSAQDVPVIDLTARSAALIESLGPDESSKLYLTTATDGVADNTHFSEYGAGEIAKLVVEDARALGLPLLNDLN